MKSIKITTLGIVTFFIYACASAPTRTDEQKAYLEKVHKTPLTFSLPLSKEREAWSRAQSFVGQYSSMKIQIATDSVLETYNPTSSHNLVGVYSPAFGYWVTKTIEKDKINFKISCSVNLHQLIKKEKWTNAAIKNAHILAHYVKMGELPYPELIDR